MPKPERPSTETIGESGYAHFRGADGPPQPGLLVVFSAGEPLSAAIPLEAGGLEIGRGSLPGIGLRDTRMSRRHARVSFSTDLWTVEDLGSRNRAVVDGVPMTEGGRVVGSALRVVRTGETLFLLCPDLRPFKGGPPQDVDGYVVGASLRPLQAQIRRAAQGGTLHLMGETGSGKELAARAFHAFGPHPKGPFVAVNCAAVPEGVAERLFFGARKGAFSGATADAEGYVQAADGGTLFLDEVAELDASVQAKLLRVLETREVLPLGASQPRRVEVQFCSATHRDLRASVSHKKFREDLYYRLGRPRVDLPPLRDRIEDLPFLIDRELRRHGSPMTASASLVETCLLRPWPGNVRELLVELRQAVASTQAAGATTVNATALSPGAGKTLLSEGARAIDFPNPTSPKMLPPPAVILETLRACDAKVATAAKILGIHRTQLRRWLAKNAPTLETRDREPGAD